MSFILYQHLLWRKAANNVREEWNHLFQREICGDEIYNFFMAQLRRYLIEWRMKYYTRCIVIEYIQNATDIEIPMVIYRMVDKYAQVDPPRGT